MACSEISIEYSPILSIILHISKCSADFETIDENLFANIKEIGMISIKMIRGTLDSLKTGNTSE
jgi:hypothetical protein